MATFKHGAYGVINENGSRIADSCPAAIVYVGTAPVHTVSGGSTNVNTPMVVNNIAEARRYFGYSEDWASYTLCEAMHCHFERNGVGPLVLINTFDPAKCAGEKVSGAKLVFSNRRAFISDPNLVVDSFTMKRPFEDYKKSGYVKNKADVEKVFKGVGGKDATGKVQGDEVFYWIFDKTVDKSVDILFEIEVDGKKYGCLDIGKNRAENVTIGYFSLKLGDHDFIDGAAAKTEKDLSAFTGDATMNLYTCKASDLTTYPTDLQLISSEVVHIEAGDSQQYYEAGIDFSISINSAKNGFDVQQLKNGAPAEIEISYDTADASKVTTADVIGSTDDEGVNTGLYALRNVYQLTGYYPAYLAAPGFSSVPEVNKAMTEIARKVNSHWDCYCFADLPINDGEEDVTISGAAGWKKEHGYTEENETVYFPMAEGADGRNYHLSVLAAANFQSLLLANDGLPYHSASNTACPVIQNLYLGEQYKGRVFDDELINDKLNANGIASAAYVGGRWAIWGAQSADYTMEDGTYINVGETNRMMLYYISNDFQHRRSLDVDTPKTMNDLQTIVAEEQARIDALIKIGALTYGVVYLNAEAKNRSDMMMGDYSFAFEITTTPLAKSLTAYVTWTDEGFTTYFADVAA